MKKIKLLLAVLVIGLISGCGESKDETQITPTVQSSQYLNKIGDNGQVLDASASSWKMVEIVGEGLLVENPSYSQSIKVYNQADGGLYCENLVLGGYSDFRLPTYQELDMILKISYHSAIERSYFDNYYSDYTVQNGGRYYKSIVSSHSSYNYYKIRVSLFSHYTTAASNVGGSVLCVRTW